MNELDEIDGKDMWKTISEDVKSPRTELIYNIDDVYNYGAIRQGDWKYLYGTVDKGKYDDWYGESDEEDYDYDVGQVLESETSNALTAFNTYQQIKERHHLINNATKLLDAIKVLDLRKGATVLCSEIDEDDVDVKQKCNPLESPCLFNIKDDPCERYNLAQKRPIVVLNLEQSLMEARRNIVPPRNKPRDPNADPAKWNNTWTNWMDFMEAKEKKSNELLSPLAIVLISFACFLFILCTLCIVNGTKRKITKNESIVFEIVDEPKECTKFKLSKDYELSHIEHIKEDGRTIE